MFSSIASSSSSRLLATSLLRNTRATTRRWLAEASKDGAAKAKATEPAAAVAKADTWWTSAKLWGGLGALAGWGMSGAAMYDAGQAGPEVISLTMTPVLIVYSALFARWAWVVQPQNLLLCSCHVTNVLAQGNQMRRALEHKLNNGEEAEVYAMGQTAAVGGTLIAGSVLAGPMMRSALTKANAGLLSDIAAADAGPFTVHFVSGQHGWLSYYYGSRGRHNICKSVPLCFCFGSLLSHTHPLVPISLSLVLESSSSIPYTTTTTNNTQWAPMSKWMIVSSTNHPRHRTPQLLPHLLHHFPNLLRRVAPVSWNSTARRKRLVSPNTRP
jgi:hypothetical protein